MDVDFLKNLGLWDSLSELLEVAGSMVFMSLALSMYERLCWKFFSSLSVDWSTPYQNRPVHIKFRFFNQDFKTNLDKFDR